MNTPAPHRNIPMPGEPGGTEAKHLFQLSSGMTLEEHHQWQEILRINQLMAMHPLMTVSGQQMIPLVSSPFEPPAVDRYLLSSTAIPTDPRQFCVPSPFGCCVSHNANMPKMLLANRFYSGWGVLPPESLKAMTRRNEMIQRQHIARMEMEMHAIYQKRRTEKVNPKRIEGLQLPHFYSSCIPAGPAANPCRRMIPTSDMNFPKSTMRNLQGNYVLTASGPHYLESWGQKCRRLRSTGNHKVLYGDTQSSKSQAEDSLLDQTCANPHEEAEYAKGTEPEILNNWKSDENGKAAAPCVNTYVEHDSIHRNQWDAHDAPLEAKAWTDAKEKAPEQALATGSDRNGICSPGPSPPPGTRALVTVSENMLLDENIQKWTVSDVYNFISGLPGCSDYAQVFKDHAIDGEILPLLTEEHLRSTMGLKLGPALKIHSQISGDSLSEKKDMKSCNTHFRFHPRSRKELSLQNRFALARHREDHDFLLPAYEAPLPTSHSAESVCKNMQEPDKSFL